MSSTRQKYLLLGGMSIILAVMLTGCKGPTLLVINPTSGAVHTPVTITGSGFGATQGTSTVTFNRLPAIVLSWSDTTITVRVPVIPTPQGNPTPACVVVAVCGVPSAPLPFTVIRGILFATNRTGDFEVFVMNADGSGPTNLTNYPGWDGYPSWSPDGTEIAFTTDRTGDFEVFVMNADGSGPTNLTNYPGWDGYPSWSPDGTEIAFANYDEPTHNWEVFVMNTDGSGRTNLTKNPGGDSWPSWSPDGTKIAFGAERNGEDEVFVMNADGTGQTNLTKNPAGDGCPSWSPDGTKIAFETDRTGINVNAEIFVMNADGTGLTNLTKDPAWDTGAAWRD